MGTKIDKCSIYTDRFRRQLVSLSSEQFKSFTERNSRAGQGRTVTNDFGIFTLEFSEIRWNSLTRRRPKG